MANPKLELKFKYMTAPGVRSKLGLSRYQMDERIKRGLLPKPTMVDENGVRFFDQEWLGKAKAILKI